MTLLKYHPKWLTLMLRKVLRRRWHKLNFQECTLNAEEAKYKNGCVNWNQYYTKCTTGPTNPFNGAISFDNIGLAWVAIFLVISLEGWTDVMYFVQVWQGPMALKVFNSRTSEIFSTRNFRMLTPSGTGSTL